MVFLTRDFVHTFLYDKDWQIRETIIRKNPYNFILTKREEKRCWRRFERLLFIGGFASLYTYKHFRYHNELSRIKNNKFTLIALYSWLPRVAAIIIGLYPISIILFKDTPKLKSHQIAKIELQKFDREYFTYDEFAYVVHNSPIFKDEDSVWGRLYTKRLLTDYYQTAGWIKRKRESNPSILNDIPEKNEKTHGPRKTNFNEIENKRPDMFKNKFY